MTYNGWKNYATWNVVLWIDNEEPLYRAKVDALRKAKGEITAEWCRGLAGEILGCTTPDLDGERDPGMRWADVDWDEIADHWRDERSELLEA